MRKRTIIANPRAKFKTLPLAIMLAFPLESVADVVCIPGVPLAQQHRTKMKHRAPAGGLKPIPVTVAEMLSWATPAGVESKSGRSRDVEIDSREEQAFELEGDIWRANLSDDDCDLHLEIAARGAGRRADRVIVEIPQGAEFVKARDALLQALGEGRVRVGTAIKLAKPIPVRLTGYAFFDAVHYRRTMPVRGKSHGSKFVGTMWELHPVWNIQLPGIP